ncbi:NimC/NimA family protein [Clostridia bacterium]|nr:NimC/NimA family protein [Clostridia bacterium]
MALFNEAITFLQENPTQYLATVGLDGGAKVRPWRSLLIHDDKLWFCTANVKKVYAEIKANPNVEFSATAEDNTWIRLSGRAVFEDNRAVKEQYMSEPLLKSIYQSADNPILAVFYLAEAKAVIADFSSNPPREYAL